MNKLVNVAFVICIFLALQSIHFAVVDFFYYYIFIGITLPYLIIRYKAIDKWLLIVLSYLICNGLINVLVGNNDIMSLVKNSLGISIAYWFYFLVIKHNDYDLEKLVNLYYRFAYYTAIIGLIQFFSFLIGFKIGYDLSWLGLRVMGISEFGTGRFYPVHSITGEPAALGFLLSPATYIAISRFSNSGAKIGSKKIAFVILLTMVLSQSSSSYFAIIASMVLVNLNKINLKTVIFGPVALVSTIAILYFLSPKFQDRLDSSFQLITGAVVLEAANTSNSNGSSLILFNHFIIAIENVKDHPFGTGIGSHHVAFQRYNTLKLWITGYGQDSIALNVHDASSLLNRIISESGFIGVFFSIWFIIRNFLRSNNENKIRVLINHASLLSILSALLRLGHYFILGLPFFILCYYYSKKLTSYTEDDHRIPEDIFVKIMPSKAQ